MFTSNQGDEDMGISNTDDVIDSRDVIKRIEALEAAPLGNSDYDGRPLTEQEANELVTLKALASEAADYAPDWEYGETLIRDSYFTDYARELADELGMTADSTIQWPFTCIDWDQAARELRMDYTAVQFGDVTYWVR